MPSPVIAIPDELAAIITAFMAQKVPHIPFKQASYVIAQLADPALAADHCASASHAFYDALIERWRPRADAYALPGVKLLQLRWRIRPQVDHMAVYVRGLIVDWTARQFDPNTPFPLIEPYAVYAPRCLEMRDYLAAIVGDQTPFDPARLGQGA